MSYKTIIQEKLDAIHTKYCFIDKDLWQQEMVEQTLSVEFLQGNEICLELGGCIGRNTIVAAECLDRGGQIFSIESNPELFKELKINIHKSKLENIHVLDTPISKNRIIVKNWNSQIINTTDIIPKGWTEVATQTLDQVKQECRISSFNTLIIDCEGAFYHILKDFKNIMNDVTKVFIENDFGVKEHADYVHNVFSFLGFKVAKSVPLKGGPDFPCKDYFWQVWIKE